MTNPLTDERHSVAAELAPLLGEGWHVYTAPPGSIAPPCVVLTPNSGGFVRRTHGAWDYPVDVWLYTTGADEGALAALEDATAVLLAAYPEAVTGNPPSAAVYSGSTYLGASVQLPRVVTI